MIDWTYLLNWGRYPGRTEEFAKMTADDLQTVVDLCCYQGDPNMVMLRRIRDLMPGLSRAEAGAIVLHYRVATKTSERCG